MELQSEGARRRLQGSQKALSNTRTGGIDQQSNDGRCGYQFAQQLQPLRPHLYVQVRYAGQVAAGPVEAGDKPNLDRVDRYREDDRIVAVAAFAASAAGVPPPAAITATWR